MKTTRITSINPSHPSHPRFKAWKKSLNRQGYVVVLMYDRDGYSYKIVRRGESVK